MGRGWIIVLLIALCIPPIAGAQRARDETPPSVTFLEPSEGANVTSTVRIVVDARDANGVESVSLYVDGNLVDTKRRFETRDAPAATDYAFTLDAATLPAGDRLLRAQAVDHAGNHANATRALHVTGPPVDPQSDERGSRAVPALFVGALVLGAVIVALARPRRMR